MGISSFRSLLIAAIVFSNCIPWIASRHHFKHNVNAHQSRHRRQGAGLFLPVPYVIPGGEGEGAWGDWGEVSACSRTCGGGVAKQKRICLTVNSDGQPSCRGGDTKYFSCQTQDCPEGALDFRSEQCAAYNDKSFKGNIYIKWVPYTKSPNPCELNCMPHGERFYRQQPKVVDGTRCNDESFDVCVDGVCQPVGCDMMLGSNAREDKCRQCRGNGTNCHTISSVIDTNELRLGYNDVLLIPQGATNIVIEEVRASSNYLALRSKTNNVYYLNGEYHIDFSRSLMIAGTLWHYERNNQGLAAQDKLKCLGPTTEPLYLSILFLEENVGIEYEYSVPSALAPNQNYNWVHDEFSECNATCGGGYQYRQVTCRSRDDNMNVVDDNLCDVNLKPATNQSCNIDACAPTCVEGPRGVCSKSCGQGSTRSRENCEKIITNGRQGAGLFLPASYVIPGGEGEGAWGEWGEVSACSRTCGGGVANQKRICLQINPDGRPLCRGGDTKYFSCQTQDCPEGALDFRSEQCAAYNDRSFNGSRYKWVPYKKSPNPCELNCMPHGERFYYRQQPKVVDGTRCNEESFDVCVDGVCQPVGCDMMLGSNAREDKCRQCRSNGTNCHTISSVMDSNDLRLGYNDVLLIPQGATNIVIAEVRASSNYLALRSKTNNVYYLNGEYHIDFSRSLMIAGTLWHYERNNQGLAAQDKLKCLGPTTEPLYLSILFLEENVGIEYEYSVPSALAPNQNYNWVHDEFSECNATCGGGYQYRQVTCRSRDDLNVVDDNLCDVNLKPATNQSCNIDACAPTCVEGPRGVCSKSCGQGSTRSRENCGLSFSIVTHELDVHICFYGKTLMWRQGAGLFLPASYVIPGGEGEDAWGEWGEVSACSRTCGGGVAKQKRICLQINPDGRPLCRGGDTKYFSCQTQDCPEGALDFRSEQCAAYNDKSFNGSRYKWVPYKKSPNPCELNCMPHGERFYYRQQPKVVDGTRCNEESFDVCVDGVCQPVGCDMMLGSNAREDKCRQCRSNGTNCHTISSVMDSNDLRFGYNDVLLIPQGATNIVIEEVRASSNYLALRSKTNNVYYLNGEYHIDFSRSLMIAGTLWHYERNNQGLAAQDKLKCLGPTTEPLYLSILFLEENVGIEYEYSVPSALAPPPNQNYNWVHDEFSECNATCGGGYQYRQVTCRSRDDNMNVVDDNLCDVNLKPATNQSCNIDACAPTCVEGPRGVCSKSCGQGSTRSRENCEKIITNGRQGAGLFLPASYVIPGGEGEGAWGEWGEVSACSRTCGGGVAKQKRICLQINPDGRPLCRGGDTKYFSCQTQDCPEGALDFRSEQCAAYNDKSFNGSRYKWVSYTKSPNPCELNCMPHGERFYYRQQPKVVDGTRCNEESFDVCVDGVCQPVGCDMMLGSNAREDKCRQCRSNGTNCHTISSVMDSNELRLGYNDVLLIPQGATNIVIEEVRASSNYLALRSKTNNVYYLNGEYNIDFSRSLMIAGTLWHYERNNQGLAAQDKLKCLGPTTEPLYLSILLQEENVGIEYEYSVPSALGT